MEAETFMFADYGNASINNSFFFEGNLTGNDTVFVHKPELNMLIPIVTYCIMFAVAAAGNVTVLVTLLRMHRKSRVNLLLMHLTIADLIVTFFMIPMEVMWRVTNQWRAGNVMCKLFMVIRAFGPYLSSNILVCITLDRYFVILYPLRISGAMRRGKMMLTIAWVYSFICSFPQVSFSNLHLLKTCNPFSITHLSQFLKFQFLKLIPSNIIFFHHGHGFSTLPLKNSGDGRCNKN